MIREDINTEGWGTSDARAGEFSEGFCVESSTMPVGLYGCLFGYIATNSALTIKAQYMDAGRFSEGLARVRGVELVWIERLRTNGYRAGPVGYINKTGHCAIEPRFEAGSDFSDGVAAVSLNGLWGYIDKSGKLAIQPQFKEAGPFSRGIALAQVEDQPPGTNAMGRLNRRMKLGCIDKRGRFLWGPKAAKDDRSPEERTRDAYLKSVIAGLRGESETNRLATEEFLKKFPRSTVPLLKRYEDSEDPELRKAVQRIIAHLSSETKSVEEQLLQQVQQWGGRVTSNTDGGFNVDLYTAKVSDLTPLKGFPIHSLDLRSTGVSDLSPLQGMPVEKLVLSSMTNLTALRRVPLKALQLHSAAELTDLSPLSGMTLQELLISESRVRDLSPLQRMPLTSLSLLLVPFADLTPLQHLRLTNLLLIKCNLTNLALVKAMPLQSLIVSPDLNPQLRNRPSMDITDLSPLLGMPLSELSVGGYAIEDLSPLAGLRLSVLGISGTKIRDLSPLRNLPLRRLVMRNVPVTDLAPLRGMKLDELDLIGADVTDVSPLAHVEIKTLLFSPERITHGLDELRLRSSIANFGTDRTILRSQEFWNRYDAGEFRPMSR